MTNSIIVDSSALFSIFSPSDTNHNIAKKIGLDIAKQAFSLIVPGEIFTETVNVLGKKINHQITSKYGSFILTTEDYIIFETTPQIRAEAFNKFQKQPRSVSFTDCLVMAFADEFETKEIFGFDETFRKNGYIRFGIDKSKT